MLTLSFLCSACSCGAHTRLCIPLVLSCKVLSLFCLSLWGSYTALHTSCNMKSSCFYMYVLSFWPLCCLFFWLPLWCLPTLLCIIGMISFQDNIRSKHIRLDLCNYNNLLIFEIEISLSGFLHHDITESGVKIQIKYLITI